MKNLCSKQNQEAKQGRGSEIFATVLKIHYIAKIRSIVKIRYIAKIRSVAKISLYFFCFSDLHSCFKIFTQSAKINTIKIKKNCRKVKNKLEQRLT